MVVNIKNNGVGLVLGIIASLIWGSWPVISKIGATHALTPIDIAALRFSIAGLILFPVLIHHAIHVRVILTKGTLLTIGAGAPYVLLATHGINLSSSAHFGAIAPSTMLVFSSIGSVWLFKETIDINKRFGIGAIVVGVVTIGLFNVNNITQATVFGDLMFVGCGALWASFTLLGKYWRLDSWVATALVSVVSGVICAPFTFDVIQNTPVDLLLLHGAYQGILVAIVALYCYSKSVACLGAMKGAIFASLVPPVALVLSFLLLGETMSTQEVMGSCLIIFGMILALGMVSISRPAVSIKSKSLD
ncbi:DMT family transporter [Vibrio sp. WJH972]